MCILNLHVHGCLYTSSCFPCYLVCTITEAFFLSPILRFNNASWFYLQSLPVWLCCTVIILRYFAVFWLGFADWYMYVYMYFWEKQPCCVTLWTSVFEEKLLCCRYLTFYSFCFRFHLEVTCSPHVIHWWYRRKWRRSIKYLLYYLVCI